MEPHDIWVVGCLVLQMCTNKPIWSLMKIDTLDTLHSILNVGLCLQDPLICLVMHNRF